MSMMDDPLAMMFAQHLDGGAPDLSAANVPLGPAPAAPAGPSPMTPAPMTPAPSPAPGGNPSDPMALLTSMASVPNKPLLPSARAAASGHPAGLLKGMLMDFAFGASEAAKKSAGLKTTAEEQGDADKERTAQMRVAADIQFRQAQEANAKALQTRYNQIDFTPQYNAIAAQQGKPPVPDGTFMLAADKGTALLQSLTKSGTDEQKNAVAAVKAGYQINHDGSVSVLDPSKLSPIQLAATDYKNAITDQAKARTAYVQDQSAVNRIRLQQSQDRLTQTDRRLNIMERNSNIAAHNSQRGDEALAFRMGQAPGQDPNNPQAQQWASLTPQAQKVIQETEPIKQQIADIMTVIEKNNLQNNKQFGYLAQQRLAYKFGMGDPDVSSLAGQISNIEMNRIISAARLLKGSSRAVSVLEQALVHTPNTVFDSPAQIYGKLGTILKNLDDISQSAVTYGRKGGFTPIPRRLTRDTSQTSRPTVPSIADPTAGAIPPPPTGAGGWDRILKNSRVIKQGGGGQ